MGRSSDLVPSSKTTAATIAGLIVALVAAVAQEVWGVEVVLDEAVVALAVTAVMATVSWWKAERRPPPSAVDAAEQAGWPPEVADVG